MSDFELGESLRNELRKREERNSSHIAKRRQMIADDLSYQASTEALVVRNSIILLDWMIDRARREARRRPISRALARVIFPKSASQPTVTFGKYENPEGPPDYISGSGPAILSDLFGKSTDITEDGQVSFGWQLQIHGWRHGNMGGVILGGGRYDGGRLHVARVTEHPASGIRKEFQYYEVYPHGERGRCVTSHWAAKDTEREVMRQAITERWDAGATAEKAHIESLEKSRSVDPHLVRVRKLLHEAFISSGARLAAIDEETPTAGATATEECHSITVLALTEFGLLPVTAK